ncbi:MAG: pyridoxal phosphate-dependent aminotransferase [Bacteroidales bacterium]|nr:pyridoxal phosphate-dependent aminotransferase [Bacteroidales bacterium]
MKINQSGARYSAIVGVGERVSKLSEESGRDYLFLNRGVNSVVNIDLSEVVKQIDFNSNTIQVYPPNAGFLKLRSAINDVYFQGRTKHEYITIAAGGMGGLDLSFQVLDIDKLLIPEYYWGAYANMSAIRELKNDTYKDLISLRKRTDDLSDAAVIICDPNNPIGNKFNDKEVLETVSTLNNNGVVVIFDSPYRRVFYDRDDSLFTRLSCMENVVIVESFSKSVGLSGQRLAFIHSMNEDFNRELGIRVLYANNGINGFAQELVYALLTSFVGRKAVDDFRLKTVHDINLNIQYLKERGFLATEFYLNSDPMGIFVISNLSEKFLLDHYIGAVSLSYFTRDRKEQAAKYSRLCVSVPHEQFVKFFSKV